MALDSITKMPSLPITQAFKSSLPDAPKGRIGPKEIAPAAEELSSAIAEATQKVGEADVNIEKARREEKAKELQIKAESKKKFAEDIEMMPERLAYKELVKQEKGMEFVPTKDTVQDIAGLFGLIGVVGMVIGKGNAMQAMGAMNGMMEGHRKGRQDLFKQEAQQFEKNFKAMQAKVSAALAEYQEALKVKQQDSEAGELMAQVALAKAESPLLKAIKDKQGDAAVLERLKEVHKSVTVDMPKTINDLREKSDAAAAVERRHRETMAQRAALAKIAADAKGKAGKPEKPPSDVEKSVRQNALFLDNITDIVSEAEALIKSGKIRGIGVVQGKIPYDVAQLYMTTEERNFLQNFNALTNQKLKDQSGATVTGAEFARQRGVLPLRDDEPNVVLDKLRNWKRLIGQETSVIGRAYPGIIKKYSIVLDLPTDKNKLVTGLEYNTPKGVLLWDGNTFVSPFEEEE